MHDHFIHEGLLPTNLSTSLDPAVCGCSEEYEPDARFNQEATSLDGPEATSLAKIDAEGYDRLVQFVRYFGLYYGNYSMEQTRTVFKCALFELHTKPFPVHTVVALAAAQTGDWVCIANTFERALSATTFRFQLLVESGEMQPLPLRLHHRAARIKGLPL